MTFHPNTSISSLSPELIHCSRLLGVHNIRNIRTQWSLKFEEWIPLRVHPLPQKSFLQPVTGPSTEWLLFANTIVANLEMCTPYLRPWPWTTPSMRARQRASWTFVVRHWPGYMPIWPYRPMWASRPCTQLDSLTITRRFRYLALVFPLNDVF